MLAAGVDYIALQEVRERKRRGQYCTVLAAVQCCKDEVTINGRVVREISCLKAMGIGTKESDRDLGVPGGQ